MRGRPSKVELLPDSLRTKLQRRLSRPRFHDYAGLAEWIKHQGYPISVDSLQRFRNRASEPNQTGKVRTSRVNRGNRKVPNAATMGDLMQLVQEKLCSALADIDQLKNGDLSRLAHAVAHLTQAAISLRRWTDGLERPVKERDRPKPDAKMRGGLSAETSQALRNALLGIAPFSPEDAKRLPPNPADATSTTPSQSSPADQFEKHEDADGSGATVPVNPARSSDDFPK